ncbi:TPA: DUF3696 domain-containing protein [Klebsiella michiganensis]|nr:DUF3696 domain-containing protein [Klebsiella michiganensis]
MLSKVVIKNFKALRYAEIPLVNLNIITGVNSSGKSSLLQIILLTKQISKKDSKVFLNGEFVELGTVNDILNNFNIEDKIEITLETVDKKSTTWTINNTDKLLSKDAAKINIDGEQKLLSKINSRIRYLSAERIGAEFMYTAQSNGADLGTKGERTVAFINDNMDLKISKDLIHPNSGESGNKKDALGTNINEWMTELSPGISLKFETNHKLRAANMTASYYSESLIRDITPKNFGFGLSYCLPFVTLLLSARKGDILLIENPEAHIHPTGQTKLGYLSALVAASGVQLIIETHSDHFFNGVRLAIKENKINNKQFNGYYFDKKLEGEKSTQTLNTVVNKVELYDNGKILNAPSGFFDEWQNTLFKLL